MRLDNQRRSDNIEDRRGMRGPRGGGGGGLPVRTGGLGIGGLIIIGLIMLFFPGARDLLGGLLTGGAGGLSAPGAVEGDASAPAEGARTGCPQGDQACDFLAAVLGSTEDKWTQAFAAGQLPNYGRNPGAYVPPTLVLYDSPVVETGGCGDVPNSAGPFYCPGDQKLYIDLSFFDVLSRRLNSPGDFAQAYVVAHEVGHHVQNLIGATEIRQEAAMRGGAGANQMSVRLELQADCLAGTWASFANRGGQLAPGDLDEALNAAHNIGDDTLQQGQQGYARPETFTHGSSEQRRRWFQRGAQSGDPRQCDTFAVRDYSQL
ncbi:MAG: neutral zinc metallopeptidase [Caulobacterales bacterium]